MLTQGKNTILDARDTALNETCLLYEIYILLSD